MLSLCPSIFPLVIVKHYRYLVKQIRLCCCTTEILPNIMPWDEKEKCVNCHCKIVSLQQMDPKHLSFDHPVMVLQGACRPSSTPFWWNSQNPKSLLTSTHLFLFFLIWGTNFHILFNLILPSRYLRLLFTTISYLMSMSHFNVPRPLVIGRLSKSQLSLLLVLTTFLPIFELKFLQNAHFLEKGKLFFCWY